MTTELIGTDECSSSKPGDSCHTLWLYIFYTAHWILNDPSYLDGTTNNEKSKPLIKLQQFIV